MSCWRVVARLLISAQVVVRLDVSLIGYSSSEFVGSVLLILSLLASYPLPSRSRCL